MAAKKIADKTDKLGNPIEVWQSDTMQYTPVVSTFLRVWAELVDNGWSLATFAFKITNKVFGYKILVAISKAVSHTNIIQIKKWVG